MLFLPNIIRKERSFLLKHHSLLSYAIIGICLFSFNFFLTSNTNILGYATNINSQDLLTETNKLRAEINLPALQYNEKLSKAATEKANNMFEKDYWAHISPDGVEPWYFIKTAGYEYLYAGENLAVDFSTSDEVVEAWYNSPSHKENLLSSNYSEIGFAVVNGELKGRKTTLVVQMFGYPLNKDLASTVSSDVVVPNETLALKDTGRTQIPGIEISSGSVLNSSTVFTASKYIALFLGIFLVFLFIVDGYFAKINNINRLSGHTFFHVIILVAVLASIWYTNVGLIL